MGKEDGKKSKWECMTSQSRKIHFLDKSKKGLNMPPNSTIVFVAPHQVVIEERPLPEVGPSQMLVETHISLISTGTELTILSGDFPPGSSWADYARYPFLPGYDNVGVVVKVGDSVDKSMVGKCVASHGGHARYVVVGDNTHVVPDGVSDESAVFHTISEIVMNGLRQAHIVFGESVVVFGLGLLGQMAVQLCRLCGAKPVIAVDGAEERLRWLPQDDPGVIPVCAAREDVRAAVENATRKRMADCVFELTGNAGVISMEVPLLHNQGRLVILSSPRGPSLFDFHDLCNGPSITIIGAHNMSHPRHESFQTPWTKPRHAELFFRMIADGKVNVARLISHRENFQQAPKLYRLLLEDRSKAMGVVLEWTK